MKNIYFVLTPELPLPAIKGGAVETLLDMLISENEEKAIFKFTFFCIDNLEDEYKYKNLKHSKVFYINNKSILKNVKYFIYRFIRKLFNIRILSLDSYHSQIYQYIAKNQPDYLISEGGGIPLEFLPFSKLLGKQRMIIHLHATFKADIKTNEIYGNAIAISEYVANEWRQNYKNNIYILKNCIQRNIFSNEVDNTYINTVKLKLDIKQNDITIMFCGRIIPVKGVLELCEAVNATQKNNIKCILLGQGNDKEYIQKVFASINKSKGKIKYIGYVPNNKLNLWYHLSDIVVVPSIWEEGAGLVCLEAMAAGKALIITDSGGMREYVPADGCIVINRKNIINELKIAIENLCADKEKIMVMGQKNKACTTYNKENYFKNFKNCMEAICNEKL